jgi:hypothetical protein
MENGYAIETMGQAAEQIFQMHREISYIAIIDEMVKVLVHKGFLEIHPSKLEKFHIQTALLVKVCSVSSESFGVLSHVTASFGAKSDMRVVPLSRRLHMVIVAPHSAEISLQIIRHDIASHFKALK